MVATKPPDFIFKDVPRSTASAVQDVAFEESLVLVKSAIQHYLNQFFDKNGKYRRLVEAVCPTVGQFVTDVRVPRPGDYVDPTTYKIQIARLWQGLKQRLPCIIISETGWNRQGSLTDISGGISVPGTDGMQHSPLWISNFLMGSIDILVGSQDEHTTGQIASQLINILGPLRELTKSSILQPTTPTGGSTWEVRLPMNQTIGSRERLNIGDDPIDSIWSTTISLDDVHFEGATPIDMTAVVPTEPDVSPNDPLDDNFPDTEILVSSPVKLGRAQPFRVMNARYNAIVYSDNPAVAIIKGETIIPRRVGTFNIVVANGNTIGLSATIFATKEVAISLI
ncbi:MAG: hypothetical protein DRJ03_24035 [Chloroflexi bacterium]|nr:MAG: hypothetical protein DRJ03_24035 [Chloroflexota bacterium]